MCIEAKLRHKQEGNDVDLRDKDRLDKGRLGPRTLTSKVGVLKGVWACGSRVKSVHMKDESLPNFVSIGYWTNAPRHRMTICQNHVYTYQIGNASKCTSIGGMVSSFHHPGSCGLNELSCGICVCHSDGEHCKTSISSDFL